MGPGAWEELQQQELGATLLTASAFTASSGAPSTSYHLTFLIKCLLNEKQKCLVLANS